MRRTIALCLLAMSCKTPTPKTTISPFDIEGYLTKEVNQMLSTTVKVDCPDKATGEFNCTFSSADNKKGVVRTILGDQSVKWVLQKTDGDLLESYIAKTIQEQTKKAAVIDCPSGEPTSETIECVVTEGAAGKVKTTFTPDGVRFEMLVFEALTELSGDLAESTIAAQLKTQTNVDFTVNCPEKIPVKEGSSTECTTTTPDGSKSKIKISVDQTGKIALIQPLTEISGKAVAAALSKDIEAQTNIKFTLKCPEKISLKPGANSECSAVAPDKSKGKVKISMENDGRMRWEIQK